MENIDFNFYAIFAAIIALYFLVTAITILVNGKFTDVQAKKFNIYTEESVLKYARFTAIIYIIIAVVVLCFALHEMNILLPDLNEIITMSAAAIAIVGFVAAISLGAKNILVEKNDILKSYATGTNSRSNGKRNRPGVKR